MALQHSTIIVKRADGTTARMTLDEIKKLQAGKTAPVGQATVPTTVLMEKTIVADINKPTVVSADKTAVESPHPRVVEPSIIMKKKVADLPLPSQTDSLAMPTKTTVAPKQTSVQSSAPAANRSSDGSSSDNQLANHEIRHPQLVGTSDTEATVDNILAAARLSELPESQSRVRSLIRSALKGVRDEDQFSELSGRALSQGGLGWTPERAEAVWRLIAKERLTRPALPIVSSASMALATTTPVRDIFVDEARAAAMGRLSGRDLAKEVSGRTGGQGYEPSRTDEQKSIPSVAGDQASVPPRGLALQQTTRQNLAERPVRRDVFHDIELPGPESSGTPVIMGPVEEMKTFRLQDWRRLGATPVRAREALLAKFQSWKDESFMLYLEAREAWWLSPLMRDYRQLVVNAINTGVSLRETVSVQSPSSLSSGSRSPKDNLGEADVVALIEVNGHLTV